MCQIREVNTDEILKQSVVINYHDYNSIANNYTKASRQAGKPATTPKSGNWQNNYKHTIRAFKLVANT